MRDGGQGISPDSIEDHLCISPVAMKDFSDGFVAVLQRQLQRRMALLVLGVNICSMHEEAFHHAPTTLVCRNVQWGVTVTTVPVDIGSVYQKEFGHIPAILLRRPIQWS